MTPEFWPIKWTTRLSGTDFSERLYRKTGADSYLKMSELIILFPDLLLLKIG